MIRSLSGGIVKNKMKTAEAQPPARKAGLRPGGRMQRPLLIPSTRQGVGVQRSRGAGEQRSRGARETRRRRDEETRKCGENLDSAFQVRRGRSYACNIEKR